MYSANPDIEAAFKHWLEVDCSKDNNAMLFGFNVGKGTCKNSKAVTGYRNMAWGFYAGYMAAINKEEGK